MKKIYYLFRNFVRQLARDNITAFASSTAFFFFLSLVPILIILCSLLPLTPLTEGNLIEAAAGAVPDFLDSVVVSIIQQIYNRSANFLPAAIFLMVWSSGKGMLALMRGLNVVNGVTENRNYFLLRLEASFYMVVTVAALLASLVISVFGEALVNTLVRMLPQIKEILFLLMRFRFLFVLLLLTAGFTLTYTYVPNKKMKMRYQIPGAIFASLGWSIASFFFSIYVEGFHGMSVYGSLSTIIIMMFWLYCCLYILLIGANLNRYFRPLIQVFIRE